MVKALLFIIPAILVFTYSVCEGLECYHCYSSAEAEPRDSKFVRCNEQNLTASNTWVCPSEKSKCIHATVENEYTGEHQIWRACSNPVFEPCDPNSLQKGIKMLKCSYCGTDRCNLNGTETKPQNTFTFNINADINLFIRR